MQQQTPPEAIRFGRHGRRSQQPAAAEDDRDRHQDVRARRGHGRRSRKSGGRSAVHTTDQIVSMASRLGWTVGITADDLVGAQCRAVIGLAPQDEKWLAGENYVGVWHGTAEDARKRQEALDVVPFGQYQAMAVSPLTSGRLNPPDICLVYATPGQMIILINGLQYTGYKKFEWGVVGETACADSWGRALKTGEPQLSLPCFAERRYGGVPDEEMLMALSAGASCQGHRRHEAAGQERPALSDRALWHPGRRARRHGRVLRQEISRPSLRGAACARRVSDEAIHSVSVMRWWIASLRSQ